ncbi:hypothetical protein ABIA32_005984 [Streptacidiphilus sp. MAP12-20]
MRAKRIFSAVIALLLSALCAATVMADPSAAATATATSTSTVCPADMIWQGTTCV